MTLEISKLTAIPGDSAFRRSNLRGTELEATYAGALSYMRRKYSRDLAGVDIALTGIPFDQAVSNRPGTRFGPEAIRKASVEHAWAHPSASAAYVAEHADEMSPDVQRRHIDLYVNEFTRDLGDEGYAAASALLDRAYKEGLTPSSPPLR